MGRGGGRRGAARGAAERHARRPLRRAAAAQRRPAAAGAGLRPAWLSVAVPRGQAGGRHLAAQLRGRPGALAERPLVGHCRPHAGAVGRRLRAGEPAGRRARLPGNVPRPARRAPRRLLPRPAGRAGGVGAGRGRRAAACRAADAGAAQRNLFRACLPGALPRLPARRGAGPDGARRHRLPQDAARPQARARDPAPPGRQLLRPARTARRVGTRRARPAQCRPRRPRRHRQRAGQRPAHVRGADGLPAGDLRAPARREAGDALGGDLVVRREAGAEVRARTPRRSRHQAGLPVAAHGPGFRPRPQGRGARRDAAPDRCAAACLRRPGDGRPVAGADLEPHARAAADRAAGRPARLRRGRWRRPLFGDAGRAGAGGDRRHCPHHLDAAGRGVEGCLGADRGAGQRIHDAQAVGRRARPGAGRRQPDLARRREPVLARPLFRALRRQRAHAARRAVARRRGGRAEDAGSRVGDRTGHAPRHPARAGGRGRRARPGPAASTRCSPRSTIPSSRAAWPPASAA